jgi:cytochrome c oxidase cbb3-type subunit 2
MKDAANPPSMVPVVATVLAIAATYGYFLLFAEFALLELAKPLFGGEAALRPLLAMLCGGGVAGSLLAAWRFEAGYFRGALATGFVGCALSAAATLVVGRTGLWWAVAGVGMSLGWTTVTLSSGLRAVAGAGRLGLWCGFGTGLAYAVSNVPAVFAATPQLQTMIALSLALAGGLAASFLKPGITGVAETPDYKPLGRFLWGVIFLALVWLDSAGFYVLQHNYALRAQTWSGEWTLWGNAVTHLLGALLAGLALDARRSGGTALVALVLLVSADTLLNRGVGQFFGTRMCYTMGVSAYSVALVYYPAIGARPWSAARLFSLAGWIGSALGIGMVQDLHSIPVWFIGLATGVVLIALAVRHGSLRGRTAMLLIGMVALCFNPRPLRADETIVTRGREVYLAEGCINCHSQYVRPRVSQEVLWWGPARPLAETLAEAPPLIGLRRQGPDLMNVGNRRSPDWQRLHLMRPQEVSPGSRMPSYAYLFQGADDRGESLVAYLATLGSETLPARLQQAASWSPTAEAMAAPFSRTDAQRQFGQRCASCHGTDGRGDGPLVVQLSLKPPDFLQDNWRHLLPNEPVRVVALARIIKFGVPGTVMAGHEYLDDSSVVQLARVVEAMHR